MIMKDKEKKANGFAPCEGCERECPITADMTELTYDDGYEQAMIDCRDGAETSYLDGYKDCFYGEPPAVEDDEIREILSEQLATPKGCRVTADTEKVVNGDLYISGKILCMIEDAKEKLFEVRKQIYTPCISAEKQKALAFRLFAVEELLDKVQHEYTSDAMYEYLGYIE